MIARVPIPAALLLALLLARLLALPAAPAVAQEDVAACFCLAEPAGGSVAYNGCSEATPPTRVTPIVQCTEAGTGVRRTVLDASAYDRLPAGEAACNPCRPRLVLDPRTTRPRGEGPEPAAEAEQ